MKEKCSRAETCKEQKYVQRKKKKRKKKNKDSKIEAKYKQTKKRKKKKTGQGKPGGLVDLGPGLASPIGLSSSLGRGPPGLE